MARGDIKRFREHLNSQDDGESNHQHGRYQQRKRKYGDYLYAQDREKFMVDMEEWLRAEADEKLRLARLNQPKGVTTEMARDQREKLKRQVMDQELKKLRREISDAKRTLNRPQSYGAQVIGYSLKHIAETFGKAEANKAIVELGLEKCGWKQET